MALAALLIVFRKRRVALLVRRTSRSPVDAMVSAMTSIWASSASAGGGFRKTRQSSASSRSQLSAEVAFGWASRDRSR